MTALILLLQLRNVVHLLQRDRRRYPMTRPPTTRGHTRSFLDKVRSRRSPHLPLERFIFERGDHHRYGHFGLWETVSRDMSATKVRREICADSVCHESTDHSTHQEARGLCVELLTERHDVESVLKKIK